MLEERELREPPGKQNVLDIPDRPGATPEGVRQITPVLDHHDVADELAHSGDDRQIAAFRVDLENAGAGRDLAGGDEGRVATGR